MTQSKDTLLRAEGLCKTFTLHLRGGVNLPVLDGTDVSAAAGECVGLLGPSGVGKSTLLRCLYGNYRPQAGCIEVWHEGGTVELLGASAPLLLAVRRRTIGYVSQFLRVIPRIGTLDLVIERALAFGLQEAQAKARAADMLHSLNLPERLWPLPPATFSGGEQQRVNLARVLVADYPILLLDEPTAALDPDNRDAVIALIRQRIKAGAAAIGIFHDIEARRRLIDRGVTLTAAREAA
jgi:alpha-D-ribose 1-methylphosphonate 5-triphosphate synthase subunit PhnL